jgi:hypothetical protein
MNLVVWNISLVWNIEIPKSFDFDVIEIVSETWNKNIYLFWETEITSSEDFISMCSKEMGEIRNYDLSISTEDNIELSAYDFEEWIYELASFEWKEVTFEEIKDRFSEHDAIFSVREAEVSEKFWNRVIKADFVY